MSLRCPACHACAMCEGSQRITCARCPHPHRMDCPGCDLCGLCRGTHLVTDAQFAAWLEAYPPKEKP